MMDSAEGFGATRKYRLIKFRRPLERSSISFAILRNICSHSIHEEKTSQMMGPTFFCAVLSHKTDSWCQLILMVCMYLLENRDYRCFDSMDKSQSASRNKVKTARPRFNSVKCSTVEPRNTYPATPRLSFTSHCRASNVMLSV